MQAFSLSTTQLLHQGEIRWIPTSCPACPHAILATVSECLVTSTITLTWLPTGAWDLIPGTWAQRWQIVMSSSLMIDVTLKWVSQSCRFVLLTRKKFIFHYFYDRVTAFGLQSTKRWNVKKQGKTSANPQVNCEGQNQFRAFVLLIKAVA